MVYPRHRTNSFAYLVLTLAMLCLAGNHVIGRGVHTEVPPVGLAFWRWLVAALILLPFVWTGLKASRATVRAHLGPLSLLGCLMIGSTTLMLVALNFTTAVNAALINGTQPTLTVAFSWLFLQVRLTRMQNFGVASALAGVIVMVSRADWHVLSGLHFNTGDILALLAMCGFAAYAINIRKIPPQLSAAEALFVIIVAGCIALAPLYLAESIFYRTVPVNRTAISAIIALAVFASLLAMLAWNVGNRIIGPNSAGMFINLIPLFGALLAVVFLGESLYGYHFIGAGLVGLGIFLVVGWYQGAKESLAG
jgi:drug/metabolite transporter (DMT)-like permease